MKTEQDAIDFANTISDAGDAALFRDLWERKDFDLIKGHFPAFMAEQASGTEGTEGTEGTVAENTSSEK